MGWEAVYAFVKKIPRGKVVTYGGVAKAIKLKGGARTAGHAMAATPSGQAIPWHRVVGAGGKLLIREPYASLQKKLLASEGAQITVGGKTTSVPTEKIAVADPTGAGDTFLGGLIASLVQKPDDPVAAIHAGETAARTMLSERALQSAEGASA